MYDEINQFCGICFWYSLDDDPRVGEWCMKHNCKTECFSVRL